MNWLAAFLGTALVLAIMIMGHDVIDDAREVMLRYAPAFVVMCLLAFVGAVLSLMPF